MDKGVLQLLMRDLSLVVHDPAVEDNTKNKLFYAITSVIRSVPYAQHQFIKFRGFVMIQAIFLGN